MTSEEDRILGIVDTCWSRMQSREGFRNLNLREQENLKGMIVETVRAMLMAKTASDDMSGLIQQGFGDLKKMIAAGGGSGGMPNTTVSQPMSKEAVDAIVGHFMSGDVRSNLNEVAVEGGETSQVDATVARLRKIGGSNGQKA